MVGDPNWLYSTIAQSSAAIVAILGGFIMASVLSLVAEKRSLINQRTDRVARLDSLRKEEKRIIEEEAILRVHEFLYSMRDKLSNADEWPSLEIIMKDHPETENFDVGILEREYEKLSKQTLEARQFIEKHSEKIDVMGDLPFDEWVTTNALDISTYDIYILEEEYIRTRDIKREALSEDEKKYISKFWPNSIRIRTPTWTLWDQRELEHKEEQLHNIKYEISALSNEISSLDTRISYFSYPPYLRGGIAVLVYLAVSGILIPIFVIGYELYNNTIKQWIIALFSIGISLIFAYIIYLVNRLIRR